jgi:epoxide hydrolase-like predicted phosphatase
MIKSIVFDWGGVLIEDPSQKIFAYCAKALLITPKEFQHIYQKFTRDFQKGIISEQILWKKMCSELGIQKPTIPSLWETAFRQAYREKKEIFTLASTLKKNGYRIGFLSNTEVPAMKFFYEQKYPMFDVTVFSCNEGTRKPEERIYQILVQRLQLQPEETLFIDDNEEFIQGAEQVGIKTIRFKNHHQLQKAFTTFSIAIEKTNINYQR